MKLLVLSDLHVQHSPFTPHPGAGSAADVVVLAGDILGFDSVASWARSNFPEEPIVLVSGNHELYHGHWERSIDLMRESARSHGVHFLENDAVTIASVRFLGTTRWTDFDYFGEDRREESIAEARTFIADYRLIKGCAPQCHHRASLCQRGLVATRVGSAGFGVAAGGGDAPLSTQRIHASAVPSPAQHCSLRPQATYRVGR